jgi:hypothetical protein
VIHRVQGCRLNGILCDQEPNIAGVNGFDCQNASGVPEDCLLEIKGAAPPYAVTPMSSRARATVRKSFALATPWARRFSPTGRWRSERNSLARQAQSELITRWLTGR